MQAWRKMTIQRKCHFKENYKWNDFQCWDPSAEKSGGQKQCLIWKTSPRHTGYETLHPVQWAAEPRTILSMKLKNYSIFTILLTNCTSTSPSNSSGDREECGEQQHMELELETKAGLSGTWSAARASWAVVCRAREVLPLLRKAQHGERTPKTTFLWQTGTQD